MDTGVSSIIAVILAAGLSVIGAMALLILRDIRETLRDHSRHLNSLMAVQWQQIWRTNGIEDFLAERCDYRPPRMVGKAETAP